MTDEASTQPGGQASGPVSRERRQLSRPTKEQSAFLMREVGYQERLVGYKMHPRAGTRTVPLATLAQAADFMHFDDDALVPGSRASIGYVDPDALRRWVGEIFHDGELAAAIEEAIASADNYRDRAIPVQQLVAQRVGQCHAMLAGDAWGDQAQTPPAKP